MCYLSIKCQINANIKSFTVFKMFNFSPKTKLNRSINRFVHLCAHFVILSYADFFSATCPCQEIPQRRRTIPPPQACRQINDIFRYSCIKGYVRKAGTSNLIKCINSGVWTPFNLECIRKKSIFCYIVCLFCLWQIHF